MRTQGYNCPKDGSIVVCKGADDADILVGICDFCRTEYEITVKSLNSAETAPRFGALVTPLELAHPSLPAPGTGPGGTHVAAGLAHQPNEGREFTPPPEPAAVVPAAELHEIPAGEKKLAVEK